MNNILPFLPPKPFWLSLIVLQALFVVLSKAQCKIGAVSGVVWLYSNDEWVANRRCSRSCATVRKGHFIVSLSKKQMRTISWICEHRKSQSVWINVQIRSEITLVKDIRYQWVRKGTLQLQMGKKTKKGRVKIDAVTLTFHTSHTFSSIIIGNCICRHNNRVLRDEVIKIT